MISKKKVVIPILLISSLMCSCSKKSVNTDDLNKTVLEISNYSSNKENGTKTDKSKINDAVIKNIDKLLELKGNSDTSDVILTNDKEFNDMMYQISQAIIDKYCNDHYSDAYNQDEEETVLSEEDIQRENERIDESSKYNAIISDLVKRIDEIDKIDKTNIDEYIGEVEEINSIFNSLPDYYKPNVLNKKKLFEALKEVDGLKESLSAETNSSGENTESNENVVETSESAETTAESAESTGEAELETVTVDVNNLETVGNVEYLKDNLNESNADESETTVAEQEISEAESEAEKSESESDESNENNNLNYLELIPENWLDDVIDNGPFDVKIDTKKLYEDIASLNKYLRVDGDKLILDRKALNNKDHICTIKFSNGLVLYVEETIYKVNKYDSVKDYIYWDDNSFKVRCVDSNGKDVTFVGYYDKNGDVNIISGLSDLVKENVVTIYFELG